MTHSFFEKITFYNFNDVDSTNDSANLLLKQNKAENGDVIIAGFQNNGKGQAGNGWFAERNKSVLLSLICKDINIEISLLPVVNMLVSLALTDTISTYLKVAKIQIKWPNDIFVNDKKISGILIESNIGGDLIKNLIIGIGLNVNESKFPNFLPNACSFYTISNKTFDIEEITGVLLGNLNRRLADLKSADKQKIKKEYETKLYGKDMVQLFRSKSETFSGKIKGVNLGGQLEIEKNNNIEIFNNKEIEFVRSSN